MGTPCLQFPAYSLETAKLSCRHRSAIDHELASIIQRREATAGGEEPPSTWMMMSTPPSRALAAAANASQPSRVDRSAGTCRASGTSLLGCLAEVITVAPSAKRRSTTALPTPLVPRSRGHACRSIQGSAWRDLQGADSAALQPEHLIQLDRAARKVTGKLGDDSQPALLPQRLKRFDFKAEGLPNRVLPSFDSCKAGMQT